MSSYGRLRLSLLCRSLGYRLTAIFLTKYLRECHCTLNAFFPCITLERKEHILPALGDGWQLEEVARYNNLVAVSRCGFQNYMFNNRITWIPPNGLSVFLRSILERAASRLKS